MQSSLPRTEDQAGSEVEIYQMFLLKSKKELFVCERSNRLAIVDAESLELTKSFFNDNNDDYVAGSISP